MRLWGWFLTGGLLFAGASQAAESDVTSTMPVLLKVLTYDQNFDARGAGQFTVLVLSEPGQASVREAALSQLKDMPTTRIKNRPVKFVGADYRDEAQLQADIDKHKPSALLAMPGTSIDNVTHLWEVAQDNQLYALALDASMVERVLPVGVMMVGDKPQIVINEKATKAVGIRFETSVLRLARVIQ